MAKSTDKPICFIFSVSLVPGVPAGHVPAAGVPVVSVQLLVRLADGEFHRGAFRGRALPALETPAELGADAPQDGDRGDGALQLRLQRAAAHVRGRARDSWRIHGVQSQPRLRRVSSGVCETRRSCVPD